MALYPPSPALTHLNLLLHLQLFRHHARPQLILHGHYPYHIIVLMYVRIDRLRYSSVYEREQAQVTIIVRKHVVRKVKIEI